MAKIARTRENKIEYDYLLYQIEYSKKLNNCDGYTFHYEMG